MGRSSIVSQWAGSCGPASPGFLKSFRSGDLIWLRCHCSKSVGRCCICRSYSPGEYRYSPPLPSPPLYPPSLFLCDAATLCSRRGVRKRRYRTLSAWVIVALPARRVLFGLTLAATIDESEDKCYHGGGNDG